MAIKKPYFLVLLLVASMALSACVSSGGQEDPDTPGSGETGLLEQARKEGNRLHIYDWAEWWPEEIYEGFSEEYGIEIVRDNFADLDEMLTKFKLQPTIEYDLTLCDPRTLMQMKELGLVQEIEVDGLPNVRDYLMDEMWNVEFNPECRYGVPTDLYFLGYCYNSDYVDESDPRIGSWALLFEGDEYAGKMTMLDDMFNVIGCALKYLGYSYNSDDEQELSEAREVVLRQKPWVIAFDSWPKRIVLEELAFVSHSWAGESWFYYQDLESIRGVIPREGTEMGADYLVIPKGATHPAAAHLFIDYLFRPEVNALLIEAIGYAPVHKEVPDLLPQEMREWPGVVPPADLLDKCEFISPTAFTGKGLEARVKIWEDIKK